MYENACRLMAKQTVALEVLSFHATAGKEETEKLVVSLNLFSFVLSSVISVDNIWNNNILNNVKFSVTI